MDYIIRGIDKTKSFRVFGASTTNLVNIATKRHLTTPVASACLGRTMTGVVIMAQMEKNPADRVSIIIKGDGPIGGIVAEANGMGDVKGYVYNPNVNIPKNEQGKLDVSGAIGNAVMTVMKDLGLKEPYIGQVAMISGEIAEDLTYYFATSEQTNSMVALGVSIDKDYSVKHSAGIIIQVLPNAQEEAIVALEEKLKSFTSLTNYLEEGKKVEQVIENLLGAFDLMEKTDLQFNCDCSKGRMEKGLISLGKEELQSIVEDNQDDVELVCHFCNEKYLFDKEEIKQILEQL